MTRGSSAAACLWPQGSAGMTRAPHEARALRVVSCSGRTGSGFRLNSKMLLSWQFVHESR